MPPGGWPICKELGRLTLELTGDAALAQAVAGANTAREALEILTAARARPWWPGGRLMLAALRELCRARARSSTAVVLDFDGAPLGGESRREAAA